MSREPVKGKAPIAGFAVLHGKRNSGSVSPPFSPAGF